MLQGQAAAGTQRLQGCRKRTPTDRATERRAIREAVLQKAGLDHKSIVGSMWTTSCQRVARTAVPIALRRRAAAASQAATEKRSGGHKEVATDAFAKFIDAIHEVRQILVQPTGENVFDTPEVQPGMQYACLSLSLRRSAIGN